MEEQSVEEIIDEVKAQDAPTGETPAPVQDAPSTPADWRQSFQWEFDHNGQKVSPDSAEKAKTWLSLGHNYSQRAAELNKTQAQLLREREQLQSKYKGYDRFQEVNEYAQKNPEWWQHVEQSWSQREQQQGLSPELQALHKELAELKGWKQSLDERETQKSIQEQDQRLDAEISEIRKSYPTIDLSAADETGKTLEWRVLKHGHESGINSFRAAFRDYLHDKLQEEAKATALTSVAKEKEQKAKQGLLGTTPTPTKGLKPASNVRGKSYEDLALEGLKEFGIN